MTVNLRMGGDGSERRKPPVEHVGFGRLDLVGAP